jgi:hypothetical protein
MCGAFQAPSLSIGLSNSSKIWFFYQSLAREDMVREDTNHTLSKKAKNESHHRKPMLDGFLTLTHEE